MADFAIETTKLRKVYGSKVAVADLSLAVPRGEVFGFLGPNGAGKSTSLKMLLGLVRPSGGSARVLGFPPDHAPTKARIGFLPEHFRFHEWLPAASLLDFHGRLYGIEPGRRKKRITEVLEAVGLSEHANQVLSSFSKGMLQRLGLAQALLNEPALIFLDEPTSGLDPLGRRLVRNLLHELKAQGTTIFLNSHLLSDVEATCDRVAFIKSGAVLQTLNLAELSVGQLRVEIRVDEVSPALLAEIGKVVVDWHFLDDKDSPPLKTAWAGQNGLSSVEETSISQATLHQATRLEVILKEEEYLPLLADRIHNSGARLYALIPRPVSLEQLFLEVVGDEDSGQ